MTLALKGTGANLCKITAKRRRTKGEVAQEKLLREAAAEAMKAKEDEIAELKRVMDSFSDQNGDVIERVGFIQELMNQGKVVQNENGQYQFVENQG